MGFPLGCLPKKDISGSFQQFNVEIPFLGGICCDLGFKIEILWVVVTDCTLCTQLHTQLQFSQQMRQQQHIAEFSKKSPGLDFFLLKCNESYRLKSRLEFYGSEQNEHLKTEPENKILSQVFAKS